MTVKNTASAYSSGSAVYTESGKTYSLVNDGGLLYVVETTVATGVATTIDIDATVADTVPVYVINAADGTCTSSTAATMSVSGASLIYIAANSSNGIGTIYVIA